MHSAFMELYNAMLHPDTFDYILAYAVKNCYSPYYIQYKKSENTGRDRTWSTYTVSIPTFILLHDFC